MSSTDLLRDDGGRNRDETASSSHAPTDAAQHLLSPDVTSVKRGWLAYRVGLMNPTVVCPAAFRAVLTRFAEEMRANG